MAGLIFIEGGVAEDYRGSIRYVNDFDMTQVVRFYIVENVDTKFIRGWRAHRIEQRWFYVLNGAFSLKAVKIDDWTKPSRESPIEEIILRSDDQLVIHIPAGYATALQALMPNSKLLVYADYDIAHATQDDYTYPIDYFEFSGIRQ